VTIFGQTAGKALRIDLDVARITRDDLADDVIWFSFPIDVARPEGRHGS
jgi:hypothetical protein